MATVPAGLIPMSRMLWSATPAVSTRLAWTKLRLPGIFLTAFTE